MKDKDEEREGKEEDSAEIILVRATFETPEEKMAEMTDIPLDQVRPLSMMATYIKEVKLLCGDIRKAQEIYNKIWKKHHPQATLVDIEHNDEFQTNGEDVLSKEWMFRYYQLRRSIGGDHKKAAVVLAQDQIAAQQQTGMSMDDIESRINPQ